MSEEEQFQVIGRTVHEYGALKREISALHLRAKAYAQCLRAIASQLSPTADRPRYMDFNSQEWVNAFGAYPTREAIAEVSQELTAAIARKFELKNLLKNAGVEPND